MKFTQLRRIVCFCALLLALGSLSGCVGMAMRSVHQAVAPAQPVLRDSVEYFAGGVRATAVLMPVKKDHSGAFFLGLDEDNMLPLPGYEPATPHARMVLWTVLTNGSGVTTEVKIRAESSPLGSGQEQLVALAPGQRVMLAPFWSTRDQNLENLGLSLTLELHGVIEEKKLMLGQVRNR